MTEGRNNVNPKVFHSVDMKIAQILNRTQKHIV